MEREWNGPLGSTNGAEPRFPTNGGAGVASAPGARPRGTRRCLTRQAGCASRAGPLSMPDQGSCYHGSTWRRPGESRLAGPRVVRYLLRSLPNLGGDAALTCGVGLARGVAEQAIRRHAREVVWCRPPAFGSPPLTGKVQLVSVPAPPVKPTTTRPAWPPARAGPLALQEGVRPAALPRWVALDIDRANDDRGAVAASPALVLPPRRLTLTPCSHWAGPHLRPTDQVVLETTIHAWACSDQVVPLLSRVVGANPSEAQAHGRLGRHNRYARYAGPGQAAFGHADSFRLTSLPWKSASCGNGWPIGSGSLSHRRMARHRRHACAAPAPPHRAGHRPLCSWPSRLVGGA
jgi:hypothetical protein